MNARFIPFALIIPLFFASCAGMPEQGMETRDIAAYDVSSGEMVPEPLEEAVAPSMAQIRLHRELWDHTQALIPDEYENYIDRFLLTSDGLENISAYVEPASKEDDTADLSSWTLAVDLIESNDHLGRLRSHEFGETVVHEFGHILSLNSSQARALSAEEAEDLDWMENWGFGRSYRSYDCVSLKDSYLNRFFHEFWGAGQIKEWIALVWEKDEESMYAALSELSIKYHTDFVSDYAMTNVEEDFAESFTWFILYDKPEGELVSHQKILFFYDYPELVAMRDEIREALPEDLLEAKKFAKKSLS